LLYEEFNEFWDVARKRNIIFLRGLFLAARGQRHFRNHQGAPRYGRRGRSTRRRIFSSFIEMSQNIMHYSSDS
jgi:hypothetical protein